MRRTRVGSPVVWTAYVSWPVSKRWICSWYLFALLFGSPGRRAWSMLTTIEVAVGRRGGRWRRRRDGAVAVRRGRVEILAVVRDGDLPQAVLRAVDLDRLHDLVEVRRARVDVDDVDVALAAVVDLVGDVERTCRAGRARSRTAARRRAARSGRRDRAHRRRCTGCRWRRPPASPAGRRRRRRRSADRGALALQRRVRTRAVGGQRGRADGVRRVAGIRGAPGLADRDLGDELRAATPDRPRTDRPA